MCYLTGLINCFYNQYHLHYMQFERDQSQKTGYRKYAYLALAGVAACGLGASMYTAFKPTEANGDIVEDINGLTFTATKTEELAEEADLQELAHDPPHLVLVNKSGKEFWYRLD